MPDEIQPLPSLPQPPHSVLRPGSFNSDSDATFGALPGVVSAYNENVPIFNAAAAEAVAAAATASDAATTASDAATTASDAATTATNAASTASSAATAASKLNLGDKSTPPTTDNQGQALRAGATYYDTTLNKWRVWSGSAWGDGISAVAGVTSINGESGEVSGFAKANAPTLTNPVLLLGGSAGNAGQVLVATGGGTAPVWGNATSASILISNRTSNTILSASDKGSFVNITGGTFTQTLTAAATLGAGWWCYIQNDGTGDITLDPNGAELIDGVSSYIMYPNECRLLMCDGTQFVSVVLRAFYKTFTMSGTFYKPPGYKAFEGMAWGGGSSGGKGGTSNQGGGGGGAAGVPFALAAAALAASIVVTIGAGGAAVTAAGNGLAGGNTTLGTLLTAPGAPATTASGIAGAAGGNVRVNGVTGWIGGTAGNSSPGGDSVYAGGGGGGGSTDAKYDGGSSIFGGGGGGNAPTTAAVGLGGESVYAGRGGNGGIATNGQDGTAPGGGGGATKTGTQSGNGARGELRIWGVV